MNKTEKKAVGVAAGLAGLAAAAASVYFFADKKNRKKVSAWADKAKKEVMSQVKSMEKLSKSGYNQTIDAVTKQYKNLKDIDQSELLALSKELKGHWDKISQEVAQAGSAVKKQVKKVSPKTTIKKPATKKIAPKKVS